MGLEHLVKVSKRLFIGSLITGTIFLGCSKEEDKENLVSPEINHPPTLPTITHTEVDDYSGTTGLGVNMEPYEIIGIWASSTDPDGDPLEYYWDANGGKFLDTDDTYSTGNFTRWRAPYVSLEEGGKTFHINVYAQDGELASDYNTLGVIVNP